MPALVSALAGGLFFGLVMGYWMSKQRDAARQAADVTDDDVYAQAVSASRRGAPPTNSEARAAAARLVRQQIDVLAGLRPWSVPLFTVMVIAAGWFALTDSSWYWGALALFVSGLVLTLVEPTRLRRRLSRLES